MILIIAINIHHKMKANNKARTGTLKLNLNELDFIEIAKEAMPMLKEVAESTEQEKPIYGQA